MPSFKPSSVAELHHFMQGEVATQHVAVTPMGGRTALRCGYPLLRSATELDLTGLAQVIDYPARDMTITVEAGLSVRELQRTLAEERQRLAIDIPQAGSATIGGAIATNISGSCRFGHGTFRDHVIGISAIDGQGRLFSAGGRVVKNVAGYDLCKLLIGSLGTLGIVTQVTLKLRPTPEQTQVVWFAFEKTDSIELALQRLVTTSTRPVGVDVYNRQAAERLGLLSGREVPADRSALCLVYEGSQAEVRWQVQTVFEELRSLKPQSEMAWNPVDSMAITSAMTQFVALPEDTFIAHLNVPPSQVTSLVSQLTSQGMMIQAHAANGIIKAVLPEQHSTPEALPLCWDKLLKIAADVSGSASLTGGTEQIRENAAVLGNRRNDWSIMSGIRQALDPHELLNPGRIRL